MSKRKNGDHAGALALCLPIVVCGAALFAACGGSSDSTPGTPADAGSDGTTSGTDSGNANPPGPGNDAAGPNLPDSGFDSGLDGGPGDSGDASPDGGNSTDAAGNDAAPAIGDCTDTTSVGSCAVAGSGAFGFCRTGTCVACTDTVNDTNCGNAYGSGYICIGGVCAVGSCHTAANCSGGVCKGNACAPCTADGDCTAAGGPGAGTICVNNACVVGSCHDTSGCSNGQLCSNNACALCTSDEQCAADAVTSAAGKTACIAGACSAPNCNSTVLATCTSATGVGTGDVCCGGASGKCVPGTAGGDCCGTGVSTCAAGKTCVSNKCTQCPGVTNANYYVDPNLGSDVGTTGANGVAGCAFKTITHALAFLNNAPTSPVTIHLVGNDAAEPKYPIVIPPNVSITGDGVGKVTVPAGKVGFLIPGAGVATGSVLSRIVIDGGSGAAANRGQVGLVVAGASANVRIDRVTVQNFAGDGVVVGLASTLPGGVLEIDAGTSIENNGASGLHVGGVGAVTVVGGGDTISFSGNGTHGIDVEGGGHITLTGVPGATPGTGTVVATGNRIAGLYIWQTPGIAAPALNTVDGLVSYGTSAGNAIRIEGGSNVKLSNSVALGAAGSGIYLATFNHKIGAVAVTSNAVDRIDLGGGANGSVGKNVVQTVASEAGTLGATNGAGGICLAIAPRQGQVLHASKTKFANEANNAPLDCGAAAGGALKIRVACGGTAPLATPGQGKNSIAPNTFDVANCTAGY